MYKKIFLFSFILALLVFPAQAQVYWENDQDAADYNLLRANTVEVKAIEGSENAIVIGDGADAITINPTVETAFSDKNIIDVWDISLDTISSDGSSITIGNGNTNSLVLTDNTTTVINLGIDSGDDFSINNGSNILLVEGDTKLSTFTGNLEISKAVPELKLTTTGDGNNTRITRSDTLAKVIRYNTVQVPGGDPGNALDFDGSDDFIDAGGDASLPTSDASWTVSAWVNTSTTKRQGIASRFEFGAGQKWDWVVGLDVDRKARVTIISTIGTEYATIRGGTNVDDGDWHHIVAVWTLNTRLELFVDNVSVGSQTSFSGTRKENTPNVAIGEEFNNHFNGLIDEVVMWTEALSDNDVSDLWNGGSGLYVDKDNDWPTDGGSIGTNLAAVYHHDETEMDSAPGGTDTEDSSANSNHGTAEASMGNEDFVEGIVPDPAGVDKEVIVWQSKDGSAAGEEGIHAFGAAGGGFIAQGQTLKFRTNSTQRGNVTNDGKWGINQTTPLAMQHIVPSSTTEEGQIIQGAAGQSANLQEWWDSSETVLASIDDNGDALFRNLTIGRGESGVDYTRTFDGETTDGILKWMEDEAVFDFDSTINAEGLVQPIPVITASTYTATRTDYTILVDTTSNNVTITLPNTGIDTGQIFYIKLINSSNVGKITSSATIDDDGNDITLTLYESITVQWDGSEYWVI